jgi:hypothetical protein
MMVGYAILCNSVNNIGSENDTSLGRMAGFGSLSAYNCVSKMLLGTLAKMLVWILKV